MSLLGNIWVKLGLKSDDFNRGMDSAERKGKSFGDSMKAVATKVMAAVAAIKALAGTVKIITNFEAATSKLASVLGKTRDQITGLTNSAIELGRKTQYTASEVVGLQTELAKLGFTENQIKSMQEAVLKFAAAVGTDLPSAAARAGATMRGFGLTAEQTADTLEVMAVSTSKSALSFNYLDSTLGKLVPVTKAYGLDVRDTITLLGTLANAGIDASSAGTALRRIFAELANADSKLNKSLGKQPKTMEDIIGALKQLKASGLGAKEAFDLLGKYAGPAFAALVNGADDCEQLYNELQNTNGALNTMYNTMTNNVTGAVNQLKSAWEAFILGLENSTGPMARVLRGLTKIVNEANKLLFRDTRVNQNKEYFDLLWNGKGGFDRNDTWAVQTRFAKERQRLEAEKQALIERFEKKQKTFGKDYPGVTVEDTKAYKDLKEQIEGLEASYEDWFKTVTDGAADAGAAIDGLGDTVEDENDLFKQLLAGLKGEEEDHTGLINVIRDEIKEKEKLRNLATDTSEVEKLNAEIARLQQKLQILEKIGKKEELPALDKLDSYFSGKGKTSVGIDTSALQHSQDEIDSWIDNLYRQEQKVEDIAYDFANALQSGIINSIDELSEAIGTGNWDATALIKALLTPIADACISAGMMVMGTGEAVEAFKAALESLEGPVAIAAGAALIATGIAVKAGLAALAKNTGSGASSTANPYTYTGGRNVMQTAVESSGYELDITVDGMLKGQDIYFSLESYKINQKR